MTHPMSFVDAALLGAVQGATEFLPVSSDGHLALGALVLGIPDMSLTMVVLLHAGTLLATLLVFAPELRLLLTRLVAGLRDPKKYLATDDGKLVVSIVAATIPTGIVGLALEDTVEQWATVPWIVGVCLLGSALAVWLTRYGNGSADVLTWKQAIVLGAVQGLAVLPGLSRSGSTIACAMLLGLRGPAAFRTSFLLSLPAVAGAVLLKMLKPGALAELGATAAVGASVAFVVGLACLLALRSVVSRGTLWAFAIYLVPLGLGLIAWDVLT